MCRDAATCCCVSATSNLLDHSALLFDGEMLCKRDLVGEQAKVVASLVGRKTEPDETRTVEANNSPGLTNDGLKPSLVFVRQARGARGDRNDTHGATSEQRLAMSIKRWYRKFQNRLRIHTTGSGVNVMYPTKPAG